MVDGPRLHVVHLSVRERDAHRQFGGSAVLDYGPGRIGQILDVPKPSSFDFGEVSRQHLTQTLCATFLSRPTTQKEAGPRAGKLHSAAA